MEIIENFLPQDKFKELQDYVFGYTMKWEYSDQVNMVDNGDLGYFVHHVYLNDRPESETFDFVREQVLDRIPHEGTLLRARFIMYMATPEIVEHAKHVDYTQESGGALLYLNTNNGFTRLHDGTKVDSVENRLLLHPSHEPHNSSTCTDARRRVLLVVNYA